MIPLRHTHSVHGLLLTAVLLLCHTVVNARNNLTAIGADCSAFEYHLRLAPLKNSDSHCTLIWNYNDSANYKALRFIIPALTSSDNLAGFESRYELIEYNNGAENIISEGTFRDSYTSRTGLSAMLRVLPGSACVDIGTKNAAVSIPVSYSHENSLLGYECNHELREIRNDILAQRVPRPVQSRFKSLDSLRNYIADSKDAYESFWVYLDRDTDISKAIPGGRYTLATVSDGNGSYEIIYIDGLNSDNTLWQPFTIKGQLSPTIFADHFNLRWYDNYGREADIEANATVELQSTILRLTFPLLKSSMRFSRIPK